MFNPGDRVLYVAYDRYGFENLVGREGTVAKVGENDGVMVNWDYSPSITRNHARVYLKLLSSGPTIIEDWRL